MKHRNLKLGLLAMACAGVNGHVWAQATQEQLQKALDEARAAAQRAQAAAAAAETALARVQSASAPTATGNSSTVPQSTFSITGTLDVGPRSTSHTDSTRSKTELSFNNSTTSLILFKGARQLAPDLNASFLLEIDPNPTQSSAANGAAGSNAYQGTPFTGEQYVALNGKFGDLKMGSPNAGALIAGVTAQPFNTTLGGGFSGTFGRLGTTAVSGINEFSGALSGRIIRHEKTIMYSTPVVEGLKASLEYAFGNDKAASPASNSNRYTGLTLYYNKGPANVVYAYSQEKAGVVGAAGPAGAIGTVGAVILPPNSDMAWNLLAANYTFGDTTVYGGLTTTRHHAATPLESSQSWNIAVRQYFSPKFALLANYVARNSNLSINPNGRLLGLGLNYFIDDNTMIYGRFDGSKMTAAGAVGAQTQNVYAAGLQYKF